MAIKEVISHSVKRTFSVVSVLAIIGGIVWFIWIIYAGAIKPILKPNPTTTQQADSIQNINYNYPERRGFINLDMLWGWVRVSLGPQKDVKDVKK